MSNVPAAVRRDAEKAEQLQKQIVANKNANEQAAHLQSVHSPAPPQSVQQGVNAVPGGIPAPVPGAQPALRPEETVEYWKHRYTTMKQHHDTVVPDLRATIARLEQGLQSNHNAQNQSNPAKSAADVLTAEEREYLGAETVAAMDKMVAANSNQVSQNVQTQLQAANNQSVQAQWQAFTSELASLVPGYAQINDSAGFKAWVVSALDPMGSGLTMQQVLDGASNAYDARRAALVFNQYITQASNAAYQQPGYVAPQLQQPAQPAVNPAMPRTPSQPMDSGVEIEMWDRSEVNLFWENYRKFVSMPVAQQDLATKQRYEADVQRIQQAESEGRVDEMR